MASSTQSAGPCGKCGGTTIHRWERPNGGIGCIVTLLGLIFAPLCIGIPAVVYGIILFSKLKEWRECRSCGASLPM